MRHLLLWLLMPFAALAQDGDPAPAEASPTAEAAPAAEPPEEDTPPAEAPPAPAAPADTPPAEPTEDGFDEEADLTITVISQAAVSDAESKVVRGMEELGWKARRRRDGIIIFRGPEGWMGKARLHGTGDIDFSTPVLAFNGARNTGGTDGTQRGFDNDVQSGTVGVSTSPLPSGRKVRAAQSEIRDAILPLVLEYRDKIQKRHFGTYVGGIPERLDALWDVGTPLSGDSILTTWRDKRAAALDFWSGRLDSPEGRVVSRTIESWLRNTVQNSEHPVTDEERAAAEARREDGRELDI